MPQFGRWILVGFASLPAIASLPMVTGCSAKSETTDRPGSTERHENTVALCGDGVDNDRDGDVDCADSECAPLRECNPLGYDAGITGGDAGDRPDRFVPIDECNALHVDARSGVAPIDIVWVIDTSGSMGEEARIVQNNMNRFAADVESSGLDIHVVVVSEARFIQVPAPLGTDTSRFLFVEKTVGSNEPLDALVETAPRYTPFLRAGAVLHFVIVTDDESDLDAGSFRTQMEAAAGKTFTAHAVASENTTHRMCAPFGGFCMTRDGCEGPHGEAADIGHEYIELTSLTGGRFFSICTPDWSALFADLSAAVAVARPLPCTYQIPDPPEGREFDPALVNVIHAPGDGSTERAIRYVGLTAGASCDGGGWYYDNPAAPTQILICPSTCRELESDTEGAVNIALGCATLIF